MIVVSQDRRESGSRKRPGGGEVGGEGGEIIERRKYDVDRGREKEEMEWESRVSGQNTYLEGEGREGRGNAGNGEGRVERNVRTKCLCI
jgi:hypothetical protein